MGAAVMASMYKKGQVSGCRKEMEAADGISSGGPAAILLE
jgi:hypothetical protein